MKFLPVALAALIGFTDAKKNISGKDLQARVKKGQYNKQSLMRGAKPHSAAAKRRVEEEDENEEEEWAINGLYSVKFDSCLSLTVQDEDLFDEDLISYAQNGQITAHKSYILFDVCYTEDCYYDADDEKMTFITDIASFFGAFANFLPNKVESYCEGCQDNEDYCLGNMEEEEEDEEDAEEEEEDDEDESEEEEDEEDEEEEDDEDESEEDDEDRKMRKLSKVAQLESHRVLANNNAVEYIDCDLCQEYECFEDEDGDEDGDDDAVQYEFEDAIEWLEGLSGCQEVEDYTWNDIALYAGLICNAEGTGVEVGVFVDEDCIVYTNQKSFQNIMSYSDQQYFSMSRDVVEYMFTNDFSCYDQEITYINPYTEADEEDDGDDEEDDGEAPEAAEWCQDLFDGDEMEATSMYDCGAEEDGDGDDEGDDDAYDENLETYDWYSYELSEEQLDDASEVCVVVKALNGAYHTVYDSDNSGNLYDYTKKTNNFISSTGLRGGAVVGIVIVLIALAAGGAAYAFKGKSSNDKKAPLINNGSMA